MAGGQWVPKKTLIDQIRRIMINGESGAFTILTDEKRSIMFRFSEGKLIHSHCRSRDVNEAITALVACSELKFSHSSTQPKEQAEIIAAETFLQAIAPHEFIEAPVPLADIVPERGTRPLLEKTEKPAVGASITPSEQAPPPQGSEADTAATEEPKKAESEHRLFF